MSKSSAEDPVTLAAAYQALRDSNERREFYDQRLLPALRDAFLAQPGADPPLCILILPVSNRFVPVLAAARWKPQVAFPIYSSRSVEHRPFIEAQLAALGIVCHGQEVLNIEIEPDRLYAAIKTAMQPYLRAGSLNPQIGVDITGGTSVMSVGAAMAVSLVGGRSFYILSGAARNDITQRQVGTEEPRPLVDPHAVFGDREAAEARRLFAAHDYLGARRIFEVLGRRVPGADGARYRQKATLARAYAAWDAFDLLEAESALDALLAPDALPLPAPVAPTLQAQRAALARLTSTGRFLNDRHGPPLDVLADPDAAVTLLGALDANARRREDGAAWTSPRCCATAAWN